MLHEFLDANRSSVIGRCRALAGGRLAPRLLPKGADHAISVLLGQVIQTLRLEQTADALEGMRPAAAFGLEMFRLESEIGARAARFGQEAFLDGFTVDHVVHGYGDLSQAIVELAIERDEPVLRGEFGILGRCVANATANAVEEFYRLRDRHLSGTDHLALGERLALLTQELRRHINTAMLCFVAIREGGMGLQGTTSAVLERSLVGLNDLMEHALRDVRADMGAPAHVDEVELELFVAEARVAASLEAKSRGCELVVSPVEPGLIVQADTQMLHSAVFGLLQNALELTRSRGHVWLRAYAAAGRVLIEVEHRGSGLPEGESAVSFPAFSSGASRSAPGNGLSVTRRAVHAMGGTLRYRDLPGVGCVSTIDLPRPREAVAAACPAVEG